MTQSDTLRCNTLSSRSCVMKGLWWCGYVIRVAEDSLAKVSQNIQVDGKQSKNCLQQGKLDILNNYSKTSQLHVGDQEECWIGFRRIDLATEWGKGRKRRRQIGRFIVPEIRAQQDLYFSSFPTQWRIIRSKIFSLLFASIFI